MSSFRQRLTDIEALRTTIHPEDTLFFTSFFRFKSNWRDFLQPTDNPILSYEQKKHYQYVVTDIRYENGVLGQTSSKDVFNIFLQNNVGAGLFLRRATINMAIENGILELVPNEAMQD